ncbi:uncharacterized protein LOC129583906 [Paramacrobiotus metropolitanus]|uniref:uncharacterized protein LOC129583906 n=1 Tax=Paramacrobiotus metropolitanus TaxID=2943436 RepID=UPI00244637D6|nr:uncharacterized protein LOC129583906 [Paramacrobiotus metropolitanus]
MEIQGYVLESISKLRCLSITEVVLGTLAVLGAISNIFKATSAQLASCIGSLAICILFLATGVYGVITIKRLRQGIVDGNAFRILGILNIILCVLFAVSLIYFIVVGIMLAAAPSVAAQMMSAAGMSGATQEHQQYDEGMQHLVTIVTTIIVVFVVVGIIIASLFILMAAMAAKISRRNAAIIEAGARGAVAGYPMAPPGYTQYSVVKTEHP